MKDQQQNKIDEEDNEHDYVMRIITLVAIMVIITSFRTSMVILLV